MTTALSAPATLTLPAPNGKGSPTSWDARAAAAALAPVRDLPWYCATTSMHRPAWVFTEAPPPATLWHLQRFYHDIQLAIDGIGNQLYAGWLEIHNAKDHGQTIDYDEADRRWLLVVQELQLTQPERLDRALVHLRRLLALLDHTPVPGPGGLIDWTQEPWAVAVHSALAHYEPVLHYQRRRIDSCLTLAHWQRRQGHLVAAWTSTEHVLALTADLATTYGATVAPAAYDPTYLPEEERRERLRTMEHHFRLREEERQLLLLGLALMSLQRPGWEYACREASKRLNGLDMFDSFRTSNEDVVTPLPHLRSHNVDTRTQTRQDVASGAGPEEDR